MVTPSAEEKLLAALRDGPTSDQLADERTVLVRYEPHSARLRIFRPSAWTSRTTRVRPDLMAAFATNCNDLRGKAPQVLEFSLNPASPALADDDVQGLGPRLGALAKTVVRDGASSSLQLHPHELVDLADSWDTYRAIAELQCAEADHIASVVPPSQSRIATAIRTLQCSVSGAAGLWAAMVLPVAAQPVRSTGAATPVRSWNLPEDLAAVARVHPRLRWQLTGTVVEFRASPRANASGGTQQLEVTFDPHGTWTSFDRDDGYYPEIRATLELGETVDTRQIPPVFVRVPA